MAVDVARGARRRRRAVAVSLALLLAGAAGCADEQDPGFAPQGSSGRTSDTLGRCPAGGPDATTPPAGCLSRDGQVLRP